MNIQMIFCYTNRHTFRRHTYAKHIDTLELNRCIRYVTTKPKAFYLYLILRSHFQDLPYSE